MLDTRAWDYREIIINTQKKAAGAAPLAIPHYLGLSIGEADVFDSGASLLASIKSTPDSRLLTTIAIGTDNTAIDFVLQGDLLARVQTNQTALWNYTIPASGLGALYLSQVYMPASLCTYDIQEVGIFGADGSMLCRQLLHFDNSTNPVDLMISWILTFDTP